MIKLLKTIFFIHGLRKCDRDSIGIWKIQAMLVVLGWLYVAEFIAGEMK